MATALTGTDIRRAIHRAINPINRKSIVGEYEYIGFKKLKGNKIKVTLFDIHDPETITVYGILETVEIASPKKGFHKVERIRINTLNDVKNVVIKDAKLPEHTLCRLVEANPMTKFLDRPEHWLEPLR